MTVSERHRVLVTSVGLSPQVVTETLHALWSSDGWVPDRLVLLVTPRAADLVRAVLLDPDSGAISAWARDWKVAGAAHLARSAEVVEATSDSGDTDGQQGVIAFAECAWRVLGRLTAAPDTELHVSIAGGRKPAAALLGLLMAVLGRPQDRMSHVLVPPEAAAAGLFYPSAGSRIVLTPAGDLLDAAKLTITLIDIPFPRLARAAAGPGGVREFFERLSQDGQRARLVLDSASGRLMWDGAALRLPPAIAAFVGWIAREQAAGAPGVPRVGAPRAGYLAAYRTIAGEAARLRAEKRLSDPLDPEWMEEKAARTNKLALASGVRPRGARLVQADGGRARAIYRLALDRSEIAIAGTEKGSVSAGWP